MKKLIFYACAPGLMTNITTSEVKHGSMKCRLFCSIIMMPVRSAGHGLSSFIPQWVRLWLTAPGNWWLCSALRCSSASCWTELILHVGTEPVCGPQLLLASSDTEPSQRITKIKISLKKTKRQIMTKNVFSLSVCYRKCKPFLCPCALLGLSHNTRPH